MRVNGRVVGIRSERSMSRNFIVVTIYLFGSGDLELRLHEHEARPYVIGRSIELELSVRKIERHKKRKG